MGKRRIAAVGLVGAGLTLGLVLIGASPAWADNPNLNWNQPAATLLLPYFEVDLQAPGGATTIFSVNNASATAILAHVVLWSDLAVPVFQFNVYLTGYDVQEVDLGQLLRQGLVPQTASAGQDPTDTISPKGPFSQDINFASCTGVLPPAPLTPSQLQPLQAGLTGGFNSLLGGCCGVAHGDQTARGYVTVDTVNNCTSNVPGDPGYFVNGGAGDATNQNVLYGDYFEINPDAGLTRSATLVHIVAYPGIGVAGTNPSDSATTTAGRYTFYGRYASWNADDNRFPLATAWAARYRNGTAGSSVVELQDTEDGGGWHSPVKSDPGSAGGGVQSPSKSDPASTTAAVAESKAATGFTRGTTLEVWRDPKVVQHAFTCPAVAGVRPPWFPLGQEGIVIFDDKEHPAVPPTCVVPPCPMTPPLIPFPLATQRVVLSSAALPVPFATGWLYLNLNTTVATAGPNPPVDPAAAQAWMTIVERGSGSGGTFVTGYPAVPIDTAQAARHCVPGLGC